jgi:ABC-type transporter Mla subunit MlaD
MALQDLTPQLRTRLSRMERAVGIFVSLAAVLLLSGFFYYLYHTAARKGWFLTKVTYYTYVDSAAGLKVGDPVKLMGFDAGQITRIVPEDPSSQYNVYIEFQLTATNAGYIWFPDSRVKVKGTGFLGSRYLEVTKGGSSGWTNLDGSKKEYYATYREETVSGKRVITGIWQDKEGTYAPYTKSSKYWLLSDESLDVTERLEKVVNQVEQALPGIFNLTNQLTAVLTNSARAMSNLDALAENARPAAANLSEITAQLREFNGSLGRWLFSTNMNQQLELAAANANTTLLSVDTNLVAVAERLSLSLDNLASITSNLNAQVQTNTNMLGSISAAVIHTDELVQGLKRHWLLRSAFKTKATNQPPPRPGLRAGPPQQ